MALPNATDVSSLLGVVEQSIGRDTRVARSIGSAPRLGTTPSGRRAPSGGEFIEVFLPLGNDTAGLAGAAFNVAAVALPGSSVYYDARLVGFNIERVTIGTLLIGGIPRTWGSAQDYPGPFIDPTVVQGFMPIWLGDIAGGELFAVNSLKRAAGIASLGILASVRVAANQAIRPFCG